MLDTEKIQHPETKNQDQIFITEC